MLSVTMCCGIDSTDVPVHPGEASESQGKDGGAARTREAKIVVFRAGGAEAAGPPRRSEFTATRAKVVLGDGAKWIWNIASELFPGAVEIVDLWHARQHVWAVGREVYGPTQRCAALGRRRPARRCRRAASTTCWRRFKHDGDDEARRCAGYVKANRARTRYPAFRAAGLPAGSSAARTPS